jgi:hypothetical protein
MNMTLSFLFWAVFASYVVHIVDETLIGGGFVAKVREHWWPSYTARMFFFFNAAFLTIVAVCNLAYDLVGRSVLFLPLAFAVAFATHGVTFHLWWTLRYREYSPGLATSTLYWMLVYLVGRHIHEAGEPTSQVWTGVIVGIIGGVLLSLSPTVIFPRLLTRRDA